MAALLTFQKPPFFDIYFQIAIPFIFYIRFCLDFRQNVWLNKGLHFRNSASVLLSPLIVFVLLSVCHPYDDMGSSVIGAFLGHLFCMILCLYSRLNLNMVSECTQ